MLNEEWHTFNTPDLHSDAAVFQFQLMYEHLEMFRRQRWLGECGGQERSFWQCSAPAPHVRSRGLSFRVLRFRKGCNGCSAPGSPSQGPVLPRC
jgi:hypothetical protein